MPSDCPPARPVQVDRRTDIHDADDLSLGPTPIIDTLPEELRNCGRVLPTPEDRDEHPWTRTPPPVVLELPRGCERLFTHPQGCIKNYTFQAAGEEPPPRLVFGGEAEYELVGVTLIGCQLVVRDDAKVVATGLQVRGALEQQQGIVVLGCGQLHVDGGCVEGCVQPLLVGDTDVNGEPKSEGRDSDGITAAGAHVTLAFENAALFDTILRVKDSAHCSMDTVASIVHADDMVGLVADEGGSLEVRRSLLHMCCTTVLVGDRAEVSVHDSFVTSTRKPGREQEAVPRSGFMPDVAGFQAVVDQVMGCFDEHKAVLAKAPRSAAGQLAMLAQYTTERNNKSVLVRVGQYMTSLDVLTQLWQKLPFRTEVPFTSTSSAQVAEDLVVQQLLRCRDLLLVFDCSFGLRPGVVRLASRLAREFWGNKVLLLLPDDATLVEKFKEDAGRDERLWCVCDHVLVPVCAAGTHLAFKPDSRRPRAQVTVKGVRVSSRPSKRAWNEEKYYCALECMSGGQLRLYGSTVVAHFGNGVNINGRMVAESTSIQATPRQDGAVHDNVCIANGGGYGSLTGCRLCRGGVGLRVRDKVSKADLKDCTISHNHNHGVFVQEQGMLVMDGCAVTDTATFQGLRARHHGSSAVCVGCVFDGNHDAGVTLLEGARVVLTGCKLSNSQYSQGVVAYGEWRSVQGDPSRVPVHGATYLEASACHFVGNEETGAWIRRSAYARFEKCVFTESRRCQGVQARDPGTLVELIRCSIRDVCDAGIWLHRGATVRLSQTSVQGSRDSYGIQAKDMRTTLECKDSFISDNRLAGVMVCDCAHAQLQHCTVSGTRDGPGVSAYGWLARVQLNDTVVTAHEGPGIWLQGKAAARVRGCTVKGCDGHGMLIENPRSAAVVENCTFSGNRKSSVFMKAGAMAWFRSCSMLSSEKVYGMWLVGHEHTHVEEQQGQPSQTPLETEARVDNCDFDGSRDAGVLVCEGARAAFNACSFLQSGASAKQPQPETLHATNPRVFELLWRPAGLCARSVLTAVRMARSAAAAMVNQSFSGHKGQDGVHTCDSDVQLRWCQEILEATEELSCDWTDPN